MYLFKFLYFFYQYLIICNYDFYEGNVLSENNQAKLANIITCRALLKAGVSLKDLNANVNCTMVSSDMYLIGIGDSGSSFFNACTIDPFFNPIDSTVASSSSMSPQ